MTVDGRLEINRRRWDEMARLHLATYDQAMGDDATCSLKPFEVAELGDVNGKRICHMQCHLGADSLSLARQGAHVVGVDFSPEAIVNARSCSEDTGVHADFVLSSVEEAREKLEGEFDVVYTSWGVLCWLPDLGAWAQTIGSLLCPGGFLYLAETHPYAQALRRNERSYGGGEATFDNSQGDYTDDCAVFEHPESWEWSHGLGDVVTAVADAGLRIDFVHEHPLVAWHLNDAEHLVRRLDGMWERPGSSLPLSFSLKATKPG